MEEDFYTSPSINFNVETGICIIEGESYMEDSIEFYEPVFDWFTDFFEIETDKTLTFVLKLTYYNTSSSKIIFDLLLLLQEYEEDGKSVKVEWHYKSNDLEIEDDIMDMKIETGIEIEMKPYQ